MFVVGPHQSGSFSSSDSEEADDAAGERGVKAGEGGLDERFGE
jgi:hypothetical protein